MEELIETSITGVVNSKLTSEEWEKEFLQWLESRNEFFGGGINSTDYEDEDDLDWN